MIGMEHQQLRTERLTIRLAREKDKKALWALLQDGEVTKPAGFQPIETEEEFDRFFAELTAYRTGLTVLAGDTVIGYLRVNKEVLEQPEFAGQQGVGLGFVIGKPFQNRGYGTEMLRRMTDYLIRRFDYCAADHFVENEASRRVIEKCGYQFLEEYTMVLEHLGTEEKRLRGYVFRKGNR